jgi:hypothetical protein
MPPHRGLVAAAVALLTAPTQLPNQAMAVLVEHPAAVLAAVALASIPSLTAATAAQERAGKSGSSLMRAIRL